MHLFRQRHGLILVGKPRTGKTTLLKVLTSYLEETFPELFFFGFITEERLDPTGKERLGFDLRAVGKTKRLLPEPLPLARKGINDRTLPRVSSYAVLVENLEIMVEALSEDLTKKEQGKVLILDEIGKMEVKSSRFVHFLEEVLRKGLPLIATLGLGDHPFLRRMQDLEGYLRCEVALDNQDFLRQRLPLEFYRRGRIIVLEGIDGAGKTTVHRRLRELFGSNAQVVFSSEPTDSVYGQRLRSALKEGGLPKEDLLEFFLKDRLEHVQNLIIPALKDGRMIILDRYYPSTVAYQGADGFDLKRLLILNETFAPTPDLLIYFDLPVEVAKERLLIRGQKLTFFEEDERLRQVSQNYKKLLPLFRSYVLDATLVPDKLVEETTKIVDEMRRTL